MCIQAYLSAAAVDFSDCFERAELIERFRSVKLERSVTEVEQIKAKANAAFKRESYEYAARLYTEASLAALALFDVDPGRGHSLLVRPCQARAAPSRPGASPELSPRRAKVPLLSNRARAYLELRMPLVAMEDAQQCLQLDPSFVKAYHRLAAAHTALGRCGAHPAPPAPCAAPPCPEWRPPLGAPFASPPTPRRMPQSAVAHTRLGRFHEPRLATLTPSPTLSPPRALRPSLPVTTPTLTPPPRYAEASAVLQRALEREEVPAEAGMREDLTEKLRQVDAQLQAQLQAGGEEDRRTEEDGPRQEAGHEGRGGPEEAGPRPTAPPCTAPPCPAAESVAAAAAAAAAAAEVTAAEVTAAEAASTAASAPSEPASSELAPAPLRRLLALSDDLLLVCTARAPPCAPHLWAPHLWAAADPMPGCAAHIMHVHVHVHVHVYVHVRVRVRVRVPLQEILCKLV